MSFHGRWGLRPERSTWSRHPGVRHEENRSYVDAALDISSRSRRSGRRSPRRIVRTTAAFAPVLVGAALVLLLLQVPVFAFSSFTGGYNQDQGPIPPGSVKISGFLSASRALKPSSSLVVVHMGRKRGGMGRLGELVDVDLTSTTIDPAGSSSTNKPPKRRESARTTSKKAKSSSASSAATASSGGISPLLAQWAATAVPPSSGSMEIENEGDDALNGDETTSSTPAAPLTSSRVATEGSSSSRRQRQSQRQEVEREREQVVQMTVRNLRAMLSDDDDKDDNDTKKQQKKEPFQVETLLSLLDELLNLPSSLGNLRQLTAGAQSTNYRLAWVGSDAAMCHLGTGLHKVKLARLQEVFLTVGPKSRVQMYEVIRILGPFPNVRNTLVGKSTVEGKPPRTTVTAARTVQPWRIKWQSLIDGTGKEILAGTKTRDVDLDVLWSDKNLLVCAAVIDSDDRNQEREALQDGGRDLFVFVREDNMESKLDALRVI